MARRSRRSLSPAEGRRRRQLETLGVLILVAVALVFCYLAFRG